MSSRHFLIFLSFLVVTVCLAEDTALVNAPPEDKRVFGVFPNNRTTSAALPFERITASRKLTIARKDSLAFPVALTSAVFATVYHAENQNPSFGQGMSGYSKRLATSFGDQMLGNMMTEGVMPALLHEDPRYFRISSGSRAHRTWYALTRIFVTRTDSGGQRFNFSELTGNSVAVAVSNAWYPDTRTAAENAQKLAFQLGADAFSNVLKEFWPDVKRHFQRKHEAALGR